jgi:hypothetical protein
MALDLNDPELEFADLVTAYQSWVMAVINDEKLGGEKLLTDDIADDADLEPETKLSYLEALERTLTSGQAKHAYLKPALDLRDSLQATGVSDRHARQVLRAFRRDAVGAAARSAGSATRRRATPCARRALGRRPEQPVREYAPPR